MSFHEKIAIVTGSTGGLGRSIAEYLASTGAHVVITSRDMGTAESTAKEIASYGGSATYQCFEMEDQHSGKALIDNVIAEHGRLHFLINNAISRPTPPLAELINDFNYDKLHDYTTCNITNMLALTLRAYPYLKKTKGSVLNVGSAIANRHILGTLLYSVVKGAMTQMTRALASEWAQDRIRVNQINPGFVLTDSFKKQIPKALVQPITASFKQHHPLGQVGDPRSIGVLAGHLLSDEISWMTGSVIDMDGGYSVMGIRNPIDSFISK